MTSPPFLAPLIIIFPQIILEQYYCLESILMFVHLPVIFYRLHQCLLQQFRDNNIFFKSLFSFLTIIFYIICMLTYFCLFLFFPSFLIFFYLLLSFPFYFPEN